jgi:putative DNA primase/helicase
MDDGFDFSPPSDAERYAAAQELPASGVVAKPTLPPVDAEAPEAAAARLFGRSPDMIWRYVDAAGALAYCICRWNERDGRKKKILPLSWFEGGGWRSAHWPAPRPPFNADRLAANPEAAVVICEGEKAADAAAKVFPNYIATTSSGGAGAAHMSDWTALAGRRALICAPRSHSCPLEGGRP